MRMSFVKNHKIFVILSAFITFIALTFTVGIQIPKSMTDGTEGLTGDALAVAKKELERARISSIGIDWISTMHFKIRVEDVHATLPSEEYGLCEYRDAPGIEGHYSMKVRYYSFYGMVTEEWNMQNCSL
ncbi:MAG: hypothetical protein PVI21_04060 [Candidatus Woesebacteria bacterium]|jgi:hypothetical protein